MCKNSLTPNNVHSKFLRPLFIYFKSNFLIAIQGDTCAMCIIRLCRFFFENLNLGIIHKPRGQLREFVLRDIAVIL